MKDERIIKTENRPTSKGPRAEARPARVPINGDKSILTVVGLRDGYHGCWVNENNVERYKRAGYTFVENDVSFGTHHVEQANPLGARYTRNVGSGVTAYLMEIPEEYYEADRRNEADEIALAEASMKRTARSEGLDHGDLAITIGRS